MTKAVVVTIPHELGRAEARRRVEAGFAELTQRVGGLGSVSRSWDDDRLAFALTILGQSASGAIEVADRALRIEILLPNVLAAIAGSLRGRLRKEGRLLLEKK